VTEYQKIPAPFRREVDGPNRNRFIEGAWSSPELAALAGGEWLWTEKVDGTNIRVTWDGHRVEFGGRTATAQLPAKLVTVLRQMFPEELLEQVFQGQPVVLYGEGYGAGIQSGGVYRPDMSFVLFDVRVDPWWLLRDAVEDIGSKLGVDVVPLVHTGTVHEAIDLVRAGVKSAWNPDRAAEGLVGVTRVGLLNRAGERIVVKVKSKDFPAVTS
jgi:hypothetical protein